MKIYKHSGVNYMTDIFSNFKSFDTIRSNDLLQIQKKLTEWAKNYNGSVHLKINKIREFVNYPPTNEKILYHGGDYLYLELPYELFNDYLTAWTHDICLNEFDSTKCDCYKCNDFEHHLSWKTIKKDILNHIRWTNKGQGLITSYSIFKTFKLGIIKPIYNYSSQWPILGTHRIAYCSVLKSDIPFFFRIFDDDNENVYRGAYPYFKDKKYCHMKIMKNEKKVSFYLSSYFRNFDEDRDEKIGEISYK